MPETPQDFALAAVRAKAMASLVRLLLDPQRSLVGVAFAKSHRKVDRWLLSVLVEQRKEEHELGPHDVFFPSGGLSDAGAALGMPELAGLELETRVEAVGKLTGHATFVGPQYYGTYGELRTRTRPAYSGASIGHVAGRGAGTIGAVLRDRRTGKAYVLSNNHVLAKGTGQREGSAVPSPSAVAGDQVMQPGSEPLIPMTAASSFATLADWIPLSYVRDQVGDPATSINAADAAIAEVPVPDGNVTSEIPYLAADGSPGRATGLVSSLKVGDIVKKVGRTTGITFGRVIHGDAALRLEYAEGFVVFERQVVVTHMSAPGDSGSLVLNEANEATGLLVGGSEFISIFTPLPRILRMFRDRGGWDLELWP